MLDVISYVKFDVSSVVVSVVMSAVISDVMLSEMMDVMSNVMSDFKLLFFRSTILCLIYTKNPQFNDFHKCSSGSRILRSQPFPFHLCRINLPQCF